MALTDKQVRNKLRNIRNVAEVLIEEMDARIEGPVVDPPVVTPPDDGHEPPVDDGHEPPVVDPPDEPEPPVVVPPSNGDPAFEEDFAAGYLDRPHRFVNATPELRNGRLRINVGAGEFDAVIDGRTFDAGRECWIEEVWRYSPGFRIRNDHKMSFLMESGFSNRGGFHPGANTSQFQFRWGADRIMLVDFPLSRLWDGQDHVIRQHRKMGSGNGIIRVQIDGELCMDITNLDTRSPGASKFVAFSMPGGPGHAVAPGWFEYAPFSVWTTNPGWGI